jgi:integrase
VKWLDPAGYRRWRDVGLRGFGLDGLEDSRWRGRNEQRDAAFADGLYGTGLRLQEWATILDIELPADDPARGYATRWLAEACAKGRVGRKYWLPRVALTEVLSYGEGARALAVRRAQGRGRYEQLANVQIVEQIQANGRLKLCTANGQLQTVPLDELTAPARLCLFRRVDGELEPLAVWLNEDGLPRPVHAWEHTFQVANRRVERLGLAGFRCTPHMLRHSFALKWYSVGRLLYEARLAHLDREELRDFRAQFGDTWQLVALLLGHRNPQTTMGVYLEPFRALDVELLFEHAAGVPIRELLAAVWREHPRVRTDPLAPPAQ